MALLDPSDAIFAGISSGWARVLAFFATGIVGYGIGTYAVDIQIEDPFGGLDLRLISMLPVGFLGSILSSFWY